MKKTAPTPNFWISSDKFEMRWWVLFYIISAVGMVLYVLLFAMTHERLIGCQNIGLFDVEKFSFSHHDKADCI